MQQSVLSEQVGGVGSRFCLQCFGGTEQCHKQERVVAVVTSSRPHWRLLHRLHYIAVN